MNAKKIFLFSIISALVMVPRCSTGGGSDAESGFDYSGSNLPTEEVTPSGIPAESFTVNGLPSNPPTLAGSQKYAVVVYQASTPTHKLGLVLGEYSELGKMKYKIILTFDDSWPSDNTTEYPNALPFDKDKKEVPHTLKNGTATLLFTEKDGRAPRCYTLRNLPDTAVTIKCKEITKTSNSTNLFFVYTVTFPTPLSLGFSLPTAVNPTVSCTVASAEAVGLQN